MTIEFVIALCFSAQPQPWQRVHEFATPLDPMMTCINLVDDDRVANLDSQFLPA